jgi:DNA-binding NtrC family response regulator/tetratricopeptide (TPR) repeat protein
MFELLADRFVPLSRAWIDLASGCRVQLRVTRAGGRAAGMQWSDRCAELARVRHPLVNPLLDFGMLDRERTFEAYGVRGALTACGAAGSLLLTHAVRFLQSRSIALTAEVARAALRDVSPGARGPRGRALGVILQPRAVLDSLSEALDEASPGGVAAIVVAGPDGCGLRTLRTLAAREARTKGYVPVSSAVLLRLASIRELLGDRHVCVLLDENVSAAERSLVAAFLAGLATRSARRHVLVRFVRSPERLPRALEVQPMTASALTAMVFVDRDCGPSPDDIAEAVRYAAGRPGDCLARLHAVGFDDHAARIALARESSPAYAPTAARVLPARTARRIRRPLIDAPERGVRLAARGRHASAIRLLTRAVRVLEGRGDNQLAAVCSEAMGWIDRDRGRSERALESFERARSLAGDGAAAASAAIGIGVIRTDELRPVEAEAALRGAMAAAELAGRPDIASRAAIALARCLCRQSRHGEAGAIAGPLASAAEPGDRTEALGIVARAHLAAGDLRPAVAAVSSALRGAETLAGHLSAARLMATLSRTMALVQIAVGDCDRAGDWIQRGLSHAARGHLPIATLRLRALSLHLHGCPPSNEARTRLAGHLRTVLDRRPLPPLVRTEIEAACERQGQGEAGGGALQVIEDGALTELEQFLEAVQRAQDDGTALEELCRRLADRLRAATVQIVAGPPESRLLARAGRPWQGDTRVIDRTLAGGPSSPAGAFEPRQAAEPIRYGSEAIAVLCCRWTPGASVDPVGPSRLLRAGALAAAASVRALLDRVPGASSGAPCAELIGASPAALALRDAIARAARAPFPVLIEGESGSGKELVARAIHRSSARRDRRLCTLNCAALSDDLIEAELFGHARGAFTGAVGERAGLFEEADGGTLFLDEVGELSPRAQAKLLRVLQDGEVRRVGENMPRRVDVRIVAATNRRLVDEVAAQRFRADLRFRLDVVQIAVPPLRDRAADIPALALQFWTEATSRVGSSAALAAESVSALARYDWPGNVRELQNALASLAVHAPRRGRVLPSMLPSHIAGAAAASDTTFEAARHDFERRYVRAALARAGGHRIRAARSLGVSRQGLAKMLRRLRIDINQFGQ